MGVQGLWELLAPVGRRVSVETLAGKKLAIDASIWMVQFMKAMRDEKGEMVRNAHLIGFFRRICKLLFLRTKPVFIFDGGTPVLKRRTVIARRRQRENAQAKIRKTAEKLLLNHLKSMRVKELADNLQNQRKENDLKKKSKGVVISDTEVVNDRLKKDEVVGKKVDLKGKGVVLDEIGVFDDGLESNDNASKRFDQETLDAMLAASLAEEENGSVAGNVSASVYDDVVSEEDDAGDEEMMLPVMDGKVDPAVLAALPPSMQLDLLVQMRERLMAENRQKYQKVKKAPAKFSELQIQAYLKTVAFRREINEVQRSAAGKGVGGVQTSRIASEANREYIFSSSFTGDKQTLTAAGNEKNNAELQTAAEEPACLDSVNRGSSVILSTSGKEAGVNVPISNMNDVETYVDERGRLRVSRVRAMGIRMTRDLQRNLDLMKEIHQEKDDSHPEQREAIFNKIVLGDPETFSVNNQQLEALNDDEIDGQHPQAPESRSAMSISFFEDEITSQSTGDDDLFTHLVAESSVPLSSSKHESSGKQPSDSASDCSWEEGIIEKKGVSCSNDVEMESRMDLDRENNDDENDVEWEEVVCDVTKNGSAISSAHNNALSRGSLEEDADVAEAIRRSLEDFTQEKVVLTSCGKENVEVSRELFKQNPLETEEEVVSSKMPVRSDILPSHASDEAGAEIGTSDHVVLNNNPQVTVSLERQFASDETSRLMHKPCETIVSKFAVSSEATNECGSVCSEQPLGHQVSPVEPVPVSAVDLKGVQLIADEGLDNSLEGSKTSGFVEWTSEVGSHVSAAVMGGRSEVNLTGAHQILAAPTCCSGEVNEVGNFPEGPSKKVMASSTDTTPTLFAEKELDAPVSITRGTGDNSTGQSVEAPSEVLGASLEETVHLNYTEGISTTKDNSTSQNMEVPLDVLEASLDDEMLHLRQERTSLADEQRKLERNAESVSSEMFAECQELLQMFGLPYIIAPMEAEAQCAYLESAKLVDGVVTDDSDVFLFGARSVYKNIFDDRKYVETYFMKDIESELGLTREQLIRMAMLLGSDYTEGVSGIGIVNAIEVVNAFPEEDGLQKFREWLESPDPTILGKLGTQNGPSPRKKGSNVKNNNADEDSALVDVTEGHDIQSTDNIDKAKQTFMDKHRNVSKNWHIPSSFPSEAVVSAYISPQVDRSTESFSWGKPDLFVLRKLCWEKFGWNNQRADDLLVPVLKEYDKHETQLRLEAFYTFNERFAKIRSQRIRKAVKGIAGTKPSALMDDLSKEGCTRRTSPSGPDGISNENSHVEEDGIAESGYGVSEKSTSKKARRRKTETTPILNEVGEPSIEKEDKRGAKKRSSVNVSVRGRGRGRGRGRVRGKEAPGYESTETISSDRSSSSGEQVRPVEKTERLYEVRKSTRPRKSIKYTETDPEPPRLSKSVDQGNDKGTDEVSEQEPVCGEGILEDPAYDLSEKTSEPFLKDECHSDYIKMGGGFCLEEDQQKNDVVQLIGTSTLSDGSKSHQSFEDGFAGDYLAMGGGFCVEEGEPDNEPIQPHSSLAREMDEATGSIDPLSITQNLDTASGLDVHDSSSAGILQEDRVRRADSGTTSGLTAIPFLRRKRRKV